MGASENVKDILSFIYTEFEYKKHRIQESPSLKQTNTPELNSHAFKRFYLCTYLYKHTRNSSVCMCAHIDFRVFAHMHNSLLKEQLFLAETWKEAKNHYLRKYLSISLFFFFNLTISFRLQLLGIYRNKKLDHRAVLDVQTTKTNYNSYTDANHY